ncbi:hypothetical protein [Streptococcus suis]|uniref:hypothetical protein n=1 Tax=Streptococcus suis TaxID=1307 RepID=UPI001C948167|nr:hypothetical protein [Streptococcus suis]MBY5025768.1 hypothetical protein [Streptococcus suis]QZT17876.1 hypothetical protein K6974_02350 [Streptococcus suis]
MAESIEQLAEELAGLIIWAVILLAVHIFLQGWFWFILKSIMFVMLITGSLEWIDDFCSFRTHEKLKKRDK